MGSASKYPFLFLKIFTLTISPGTAFFIKQMTPSLVFETPIPSLLISNTSNLFSNNKNKNILEKLEQDNEVYPLKDVVENEKHDEEKPLINLNENIIKSENNSEQISLLDIDENEKGDNLDDVLEIPAFLRRQAN